MNLTKPKYSLVSPVYNEAQQIEAFISQSHRALSAFTSSFEIVLVNDSSTDDTGTVLNQCAAQYSNLRIIHLHRNVGQHIATSIALSQAQGEFVFMMDSDLQVDPNFMKKLVDFSQDQSHWDIISTYRTKRSNSLSRRVGSWAVSWVLKKLTHSKLKDIGSTFKLFKRSALDEMLSADVQIQNLPILMMNMGFNIIEYPIEYNVKQARKSHYKFKDLASAIILAILNFTTGQNTLFFLVFSGGIMTLAGGITILSIVIWGMINQSVLPTNILLFFLFILLIGLIFILLGILTFKLERINKNLQFRQTMNQHFDVYECPQ